MYPLKSLALGLDWLMPAAGSELLDDVQTVVLTYALALTRAIANFCREIGLKDWSSTVRKFIAIGKVYPRFIKYADQLPASWTSIYLITQIPADTFDECLKQSYPLMNLKGRELSELLARTKPIERFDSPLAYDKKPGGYLFGRVLFTKRIDDVDWLAM